MEATLTSSTRSEASELLDAVIVSGSRRGELFKVDAQALQPVELRLSSEEEKLLDEVVSNSQKLAANLGDARREAEAMLRELQDFNRERNGNL